MLSEVTCLSTKAEFSYGTEGRKVKIPEASFAKSLQFHAEDKLSTDPVFRHLSSHSWWVYLTVCNVGAWYSTYWVECTVNIHKCAVSSICEGVGEWRWQVCFLVEQYRVLSLRQCLCTHSSDNRYQSGRRSYPEESWGDDFKLTWADLCIVSISAILPYADTLCRKDKITMEFDAWWRESWTQWDLSFTEENVKIQ